MIARIACLLRLLFLNVTSEKYGTKLRLNIGSILLSFIRIQSIADTVSSFLTAHRHDNMLLGVTEMLRVSVVEAKTKKAKR